MKRDVFDLPESLYEFAQIADFYGVIEDLANLVEDEDWNYHNTAGITTDFPILENYVRNTYDWLARKKSHILAILGSVVLIQVYSLRCNMNLYICSFAKIQIQI